MTQDDLHDPMMNDDAVRRHHLVMKRLAGAVSHKMNNSLAGITCNISLLLEDVKGGETPDDLQDVLEDALAASQHASALLKEGFGVFRLSDDGMSEVDLHESLEYIVTSTLDQAQHVGPREVTFPVEATTLMATPEHVQRIAVPVLTNAAEANPGGPIRVEVAHIAVPARVPLVHSLPEGRYALITIADAGPGFGVTHWQPFDPFVSTRGEGRGLGLALALAVATSLGGTMGFRDRPEGGAEVFIVLPTLQSP